MKIMVGTNLLTSVDANVYSNHNALYYHLGRMSVLRGWQFLTMTPTRLGIDRMRNECAKLALLQECDYLIFIDDDMLLLPNTIDKLIDSDKDIVMAHTYIRGYPFKPMSFIRKDRTQPIATTALVHFDDVLKESKDDLSECDAIGFATVAIKTHLFKKLPPPWFVTGPNNTEDIYFCLRCKEELDEPTGIYVRTDVPTGHKMDPEFVTEDNVELLRRYYEPAAAKTSENETRKDRDRAYHEIIAGVK